MAGMGAPARTARVRGGRAGTGTAMQLLTVREALTMEGLRHARVLAGAGGLDRAITYVNVMEVPDIVDWVKRGELLLTTTYPLRDPHSSLPALIPRLNEKGLAGIAIKPQRYLEAVPPELLEIASDLAFPVLELPPDTAFADVINALLTRILNYQAELLLRSEETHQRFTEVMLEGGGLTEIAALLAEILARPVTILGADGDVLAAAGAAPAILALGVADVGAAGRALAGAVGAADLLPAATRWTVRRKRLAGPAGLVQIVQRPIQTGRQHYGDVIVWGTDDLVHEAELAAVEHAGTAAALAILKARAVGEVALRFRNDFLNDLLSGAIVDHDTLRTRAEGLGWQLCGPYVVVVADIQGLAQVYGAGAERGTALLDGVRQLGRRFADTAHRLDPQAITWSKADSLIVLLPVARWALGPDTRRHATWFAAQLQQGVPVEEGVTLTWGIGGAYVDLLLLHRSYAEARLAARFGRLTGRPGSVVHHDETGVYRLLQELPDAARVHGFARDALGPILDHDARHHSALLATLETYLDCERNLAETARAVGLHYNTVKARIARVDDLLDGALHNPQRRLEIELAVKAWRLHGARPPVESAQ